jgi:hypothetical protein
MIPTIARSLVAIAAFVLFVPETSAQILDKQKLLDGQKFWDNRDWDWYKQSIPFFECSDPDIQTTYYYRWELLTKHLTYGSPNSGYSFTEFIDRPFWSGAYGAISCPAGHQLYEARWLRDPEIARDYSRYWFRTPGAQPRRYSTWLADAVWACQLVHPDPEFVKDLLPDLVRNYEGWEKEHFVPEVGLFWQTGHDDGMEININSRQTQDTVRGAPAFRPTLNSYMVADARAIAQIARLAGDAKMANEWQAKSDRLKETMLRRLWDPDRKFFFPMARKDENRDGFVVRANSLTYQTGKFAGDKHGREEIGFVPWQFDLPDVRREGAWLTLMDKDAFFSEFGPTTVERHDPLFEISKRCCEWSGNSWPYATTQTLKALANLLQRDGHHLVTRDDYLKLLQLYARTHRKNGKPYLAEACNPDTGSWEGHDSHNHSEHYFHSGYIDLVITGLVGLRPRIDDTLEVIPLAPDSWDYFAMDDVEYHGRRISIYWDRSGERYHHGAGLHVVVDGHYSTGSGKLEPITIKLPQRMEIRPRPSSLVNYAVNNDGTYYPRIRATYTAPGSSTAKLNDGNYWYHIDPPNRWTCEGSPNAEDSVTIDFGVKRPIQEIRLYFLDDGSKVSPPKKYDLEYWNGTSWKSLSNDSRQPTEPTGHRANVVRFSPIETERVRATFAHNANTRTGLTEFEVWGKASGEVKPAPAPKGNLAFNATGRGFPKASASYTSRFDKVESANDGVVSFDANPHNRWTSYESPNKSDWLQIDFGEPKQVSRVELAIYDDRGGVQAPERFAIQYWDGRDWRDVANARMAPEKPTGGQFNEAIFDKVTTERIRVVFTHKGKARSGVSEIFMWPQ